MCKETIPPEDGAAWNKIGTCLDDPLETMNAIVCVTAIAQRTIFMPSKILSKP